MNNFTFLPDCATDYLHKNQKALIDLTIQLAAIPAPSGHEELRMAFCKDWLVAHGVMNIEVDRSLNVLCPFNCEGRDDIHIFMAHMDVVFPDMSPFAVTRRDGKIYAPGIGDNSANVAVLLMLAVFIAENSALFIDKAILVVANTCEEGLGNLAGCKTVLQTYNNRIADFISFDGYINHLTNNAVGSERYQINISTEGGHSYFDFGHKNAIVEMSGLISMLYAIEVPGNVKITYNVGLIEGGTSINTIAENALMLYEYRSEDAANLDLMRAQFNDILEQIRSESVAVEVELLDRRPCKQGVDERELELLTSRNLSIIQQYYEEPVKVAAASTDSNVPLSMGIPSNTLGTVIGGGGHTRGEWIIEDSLMIGFKIALAILCSIIGPPFR